jgi:hypothetical protein
MTSRKIPYRRIIGMGSMMPRLRKNQKCLIGRAARQAIEQEDLEICQEMAEEEYPGQVR